MKLSQITREQVGQLTDAQVTEIVFGGVRDEGAVADVGLLLGASLQYCEDRAVAAAALYHAGRVRYLIPSGGVEHPYEGGSITEAHFMELILLKAGVPAEAILLENYAATTKENMVCGTFEITRRLKIQNVRSVLIVTSVSHLRRSLALAKLFLPRSIQFSGYPVYHMSATPEEWTGSEQTRARIGRELLLLKGLVDDHLIDDIEFTDM